MSNLSFLPVANDDNDDKYSERRRRGTRIYCRGTSWFIGVFLSPTPQNTPTVPCRDYGPRRHTHTLGMVCKAYLALSQLITALQIRRPFAWINSRMYVQRLKNWHEYTPAGEPVLDTFAEAQQIWHLWRRRYDLFLRWGPLSLCSTPPELRPPIGLHQNLYYRKLANPSPSPSPIGLHNSPRSTRVSGHGTSRFAALVVKSWRV